MTISSIDDPKAGPYTGNGVATVFAFDFKTFAKADLQVVTALLSTGVETELVLDSDYSVTLNGDQNANPGGSITYPISGSPLAATHSLTIVGDASFTQPTDINNSGGFLPEVVENALDRVTILVKQLKSSVGRALQLAVSTPDGVDVTLPVPEASTMIGWAPDGVSLRNYAPTTDVSTSLLEASLADSATETNGAGQVGFDWDLNYAVDTVGWGLMTARYSILKYIPVAQWAAIFAGTSTYDATANIASALAAESLITLPPGLIRGEWNLTAVRGVTVAGAGRDKTTLQNVDNTAVITLNNTGSDCKLNTFRDFRIDNRDEAVYTTCDGIAIGGNAANENDFHTFERLEILDMRYGVNISNRTIWNTWQDVHIASCILDGFHVDVTENVSQQTFRTCRFGQNGGHGIYAKKASGDAMSGWSFVNCTSEKNALNGLYVTGAASGLAGWVLLGCYMEENTTTVAAAATVPRKANIFIDASLCIGLVVDGCALYGTPLATPLDWGVYIDSTTVSGYIGPCRPGTFTLGFASNTNGLLIVGPQDGGTTSLAGAGAFSLGRESFSSFTGTLTGCTTSPTGTIQYSAQNHQVTLDIPVIEGTSNTTACTITGLPAALRPTNTKTVFALIKDNGAVTTGLVQIDSAGTMTLQNGIGGGAFTNVNAKGIRAQQITYLLD